MNLRSGPRYFVSRLIAGLCVAMLVAVTGCGGGGSRSVSFKSWQGDVEQYVKVQGKGDPASLRTVTLPDGRHGFSTIGGPIVSESTDANGVLVGYRPVKGQPAFIYLVGMVEKGKVHDVHVAAVSFQGDRAQWTQGPANQAALAAYEKYKDAEWRRRFPGRAEAPAEYLTFPSPDDAFQVTDSGNSVIVTHTASGAKWTLPM